MPSTALITVKPHALLFTRAGVGVVLKDENAEKKAVIFISHQAGAELEAVYQGVYPERPSTTCLLADCLIGMDATLSSIVIHSQEEEIYKVLLRVKVKNELVQKIVELDARPSDAILLAAKTKCPIKVKASLWSEMEDISEQLSNIQSESIDAAPPIYL